MKKKGTKNKHKNQNVKALAIIGIVAAILIIGIIAIYYSKPVLYKVTYSDGSHEYEIKKPLKASLGRITGFSATEYKVPVGGTVTISYAIDTWNGVEWNWPDLDRYQYNYAVYDTVTGAVVKYGAPWRSIHVNYDSISFTMPKEGTFYYRLVETVDFLQEGYTAKGDIRDFKVIVGSGIAPTPTAAPILIAQSTATPTATPSAGFTIEQGTPAPTLTPQVSGTPIIKPEITPYFPEPTPAPTPPMISTATPAQRSPSYTVKPTPVQPTPAPNPEREVVSEEEVVIQTIQTPAPTPQQEQRQGTPTEKAVSGFEVVVAIAGMGLVLMFRKIKRAYP